MYCMYIASYIIAIQHDFENLIVVFEKLLLSLNITALCSHYYQPADSSLPGLHLLQQSRLL